MALLTRMRWTPALLLPASLAVATACAPVDALPPPLTDEVHLPLYTSLCEPEEAPTRYYASDDTILQISWRSLCLRDNLPHAWMAVKVSLWTDRAEVMWNVWFIDPELDSVRYGDESIDSAAVTENPDWPSAQERVAPRPLTAGDYRVEVWGVQEDLGGSMMSEVRLTMVEGG